LNKKILIVLICVLFFIVILYYGFLSNNDDNEDDQDNGDTNDGEIELDVDILASSDKEEYTSGETINISLDVSNNMNVSFPFGDYGFSLSYVNKSYYDSGGSYIPVHISQGLTALILLEANEAYNYYIPFDTTGIDSGDYYFRFQIYMATSISSYDIKASEMFEVSIV